MSSLKSLHNTYWLLRHGRSLANEAGIVVSTKAEGMKDVWKLSDTGRQQAVAAGQLLKTQLAALPAAPILVVTSPFSRTVETATLAAAQVGVTPDQKQSWQVADELVERYFGSAAELKPTEGCYESAWAQDELDAGFRPGEDGESVETVALRIKSLFQRLESQYQGIHILLVSHGDTLSICQVLKTPCTAQPSIGPTTVCMAQLCALLSRQGNPDGRFKYIVMMLVQGNKRTSQHGVRFLLE